MGDTEMILKKEMIKSAFNFNSLLLLALVGMVGWFGNEIYHKVDQTHDSLIQLQATAVTHNEFDRQNTKNNERLDRIEAILKLNKTQ